MRGLAFAILSISLLTVMAGAALAPALGAIKQHFSDCNPMTVQLIVSLPSLFIILTTFAFRPLCRLMRTRSLALEGFRSMWRPAQAHSLPTAFRCFSCCAHCWA